MPGFVKRVAGSETGSSTGVLQMICRGGPGRSHQCCEFVVVVRRALMSVAVNRSLNRTLMVVGCQMVEMLMRYQNQRIGTTNAP